MKDSTITLSDGRKIGFCEYGDKNGIPVFLFHGTPGSRIWFLEDDEIAHSLGIYLISTDRPGYGLSDKKENRTLLEWSSDIEEVANFLNINKFSVLGVSGGGAYAAAVSYCLPDRIDVCVLLSTVTPFINGKPPKDMCRTNRLAFFLTKHFPLLLKVSNQAQKKMIDENPEKYKNILKKGGSHLSDWDNKVLLNEKGLEVSLMHSKEVYRQGVDEVLYESKLLTKEWGFNLKDIQVPVKIWHGEEDTLSPISEVKKIKSKFSNVETFYIENAGHFLTDDDMLWKSILESIINHKDK